MQLLIVAVGHKMPAWIEAGFAEYAKRMPPELRIVLREIKPEARTASNNAATVMQREAARIETALPRQCRIVALDERGRDLTTMQLADQLTGWQREGGDVAFLIGGADGLDPSLKARAQTLLRLSSLTLPHGMVRVLLAEQLYRAWTVTQNHPYHRV
ncbi:23S rRNA (pseudouridine(1915)-N(3))-methyltransferase RlmH [Cupriavidus gilardii]|uniref:23S rRNA (pseudouridine(1915)-N(3))-methyltransferase RlmH n=1 Tax=Cupriavidus gilardii TaxID=82541 RepID=UPI0007E4A6BB|nr:23S rRNA (pseudouridine(1915)-N(3))-methyltransferase RlmH [Cupriavidus gilardii]